MTPVQLWIYGLNCLHDNSAFQDLDEPDTIDTYGIDFEGPLPSELYSGQTWRDVASDVPHISCPLEEDQLNYLNSLINPLAISSCYGVDIYINTVKIVENMSSSIE